MDGITREDELKKREEIDRLRRRESDIARKEKRQQWKIKQAYIEAWLDKFSDDNRPC